MAADYGDSGKGLNEFAFFAVVGAGFVFGLWWAFRPFIMYASFFASYYMFTAYEHLSWLMTSSELNNMMVARKAIPTLNPTQYGISSLMMLFEYHGYIWRWVTVPGLIWLAWINKKSIVRYSYRREIKDVYQLIDIQAKHFPASAIIKGKNLLATHPYVGPWATYALPLDFALDNQFLWVSKTPIQGTTPVDTKTMVPIPPFEPDEKLQPFPIKRKMLPSYEYVCFNVDKSNETFAKQLGDLWKGPDKLPPLEKALYAAFCAQAAGENEKAWKHIEQLAFSFREGERDKNGKLTRPHYANTKGSDELIKAYGSRPQIKEIHLAHAHAINVMTAMLAEARRKGRLMHSNFLWLKPVNRTLWYALCAVGGQCPYWENAGAWAHADVERKFGKKITMPIVAGAVIAMRNLMSIEHWIDPGEHSEEAQRRAVVEANALLDAAQENNKPKQGGGLLGGGYRQQAQTKPATARKGREDDQP
ncbi:hypothetical protein EGJ86_22220 [Pseudomonas sp. o96-267]|uniref:secretion/conjugation apparatus DotM-related subunit n=1 Tax=Pseudomonas sp. o96-267 TaxID=2479853 RepID=UPI000F777EA2|nr:MULTISPECIES: hypothetical protein [Pseudomonas]MDH0960914.1 hypothetical protein [Pseudomonas chengduensis]MDV5863668.1 hypothetical protein [Pseudomonas mendocina]RRV29958.1 hypothetical protein EGJ86_22220 [Pseudomonas sp. o96-267]